MAFVKKEVENFLGKGFTLPLRLENGSVPLDSGIQLIRSSIQMVLSWVVGTRFFLCEFGSRIDDLLEEPNDNVLKHIAYTFIVEALEKWEKRITITKVDIERPSFGKLSLRITYQIITSQKTDTYTFPFYSVINS